MQPNDCAAPETICGACGETKHAGMTCRAASLVRVAQSKTTPTVSPNTRPLTDVSPNMSPNRRAKYRAAHKLEYAEYMREYMRGYRARKAMGPI